MISRKPYKRSDRMSDQIQNILGNIFISDFQLENAGLLTVINVELTSDLRSAKVFISLLNPSDKPQEIIAFLEDNKGTIRYHLGKKLDAKFVPDLTFFYDDSLKKAEKIGVLLNKIKNHNNFGDVNG